VPYDHDHDGLREIMQFGIISSHSDGLIDRSLDYDKVEKDIKEGNGENCFATGHQPPIITNRCSLAAAVSCQ
jgi:hypothetical protein